MRYLRIEYSIIAGLLQHFTVFCTICSAVVFRLYAFLLHWQFVRCTN